jgi:mono/diheme cytochrome c family protein
MKKAAFFMLAAAVTFITAMILFNPNPATGSGKPRPAGPGVAIPDSVNKIFQKACMDCHADDGSAMARGKVNFSQWEKYDAGKQAKKAEDICKELTKSGMPPKKWRANNPDEVPTPAEVEMVCKWAKTFQK